jgi:hypothetical protein
LCFDEHTWHSRTVVFFQHGNEGTIKLSDAAVGLGLHRKLEKKKKLAIPHIIWPQFESARFDARRPNKNHILTVCHPESLFRE